MSEYDFVFETSPEQEAYNKLYKQRENTKWALSDELLDALKIILDNKREDNIIRLANEIQKEDFLTRMANNATQVDPKIKNNTHYKLKRTKICTEKK